MSDRSFVAARSASPVSPFVLPLRRLLDRLLNGVRAGSISIELPDGHRLIRQARDDRSPRAIGQRAPSITISVSIH